MELGSAGRLGSAALALLAAGAAVSCVRASPVVAPVKSAPPVAVAAAIVEAPTPVPLAVQPVEFDKEWRGFGVAKCSYLAPRYDSDSDFIHPDGAVDVVFHFHAGQMSQRELTSSGIRGVFVSCGYGLGTGGYSKAFEDPRRFGGMVKRLMAALAKSHERSGVHLGRLALASWSAGFASVNRILAIPEWYEATDAVILLDGLHAQYIAPNPHTPGQGADRVDVKMLQHFVRFAADARAGNKTMVITHSSIVPPDYASTKEATAALLAAVGISPSAPEPRAPDVAAANDDHSWASASSSRANVVVDQGGLHVRGFRGTGPRDHFDHLHRIGDALRSWLLPRWYTPSSERR